MCPIRARPSSSPCIAERVNLHPGLRREGPFERMKRDIFHFCFKQGCLIGYQEMFMKITFGSFFKLSTNSNFDGSAGCEL